MLMRDALRSGGDAAIRADMSSRLRAMLPAAFTIFADLPMLLPTLLRVTLFRLSSVTLIHAR